MQNLEIVRSPAIIIKVIGNYDQSLFLTNSMEWESVKGINTNFILEFTEVKERLSELISKVVNIIDKDHLLEKEQRLGVELDKDKFLKFDLGRVFKVTVNESDISSIITYTYKDRKEFENQMSYLIKELASYEYTKRKR